MHNQVNRCLSVKTCASNASSILVLIPRPILCGATIAHTIIQCPCERCEISYPQTVLKRVKKVSIDESCDIISTRKGKRGWNFDKSPLSPSILASIYRKRKHCRCLSLGCTRRNHTARRMGGTWVQSGNARLRNLDCIPNRSEKN